MKTYTVIGLHDNGEVFADHGDAEDAFEAIRAVVNRRNYADAEVLGSIETKAPFTAAWDALSKP